MSFELYCGDCLEIMPRLTATIDAVVTDPPYNSTGFAWDGVIDWLAYWAQIRCVARSTAPVVMFSAQPFTTDLICSNRKDFRYELIWEKTMATGFLDANRRPLRAHENILVFCGNGYGTYNSQRHVPNYDPRQALRHKKPVESGHLGKRIELTAYLSDGTRRPRSVLRFSNWLRAGSGIAFGSKTKTETLVHPTQKPLDLIEYLIVTFSNPDDYVLDCFMGSGTTGVACIKTGRHFIGIERDPVHFETARRRIEAAAAQGVLELAA